MVIFRVRVRESVVIFRVRVIVWLYSGLGL